MQLRQRQANQNPLPQRPSHYLRVFVRDNKSKLENTKPEDITMLTHAQEQFDKLKKNQQAKYIESYQAHQREWKKEQEEYDAHQTQFDVKNSFIDTDHMKFINDHRVKKIVKKMPKEEEVIDNKRKSKMDQSKRSGSQKMKQSQENKQKKSQSKDNSEKVKQNKKLPDNLMKNKNKENDKVDRKKEENPKNGKHKA